MTVGGGGGSPKPRRNRWSLALAAALLLTGGCAPEPLQTQTPGVEYRWGEEASWHPLPSLRMQPPGRQKERTLDVRFALPATDCDDPAVLLESCNYLTAATVGGRAVKGPFRDGYVPVRPGDAGQQVVLHFESSQMMNEGPLLVGCQAQMRRAEGMSEAGALVVAFTLLVAGALLALVLLRAREQRAPIAALGLFCLSLGFLLFEQATTARLLAPFDGATMRAVRDVCAFIFPGAFTAFVSLTVPSRRNWLLWFTACFPVALLGAIVSDLAGWVDLRHGARLAATMTLLMIGAVLVHLALHARRDPAARKLLTGFVFTTAFGIPDLLWGIGHPVLSFNVGHWGVLPLIASMALVLQDRFTQQVEATRARLRDIEKLNEELRFQVEGRSRDLRALFSSGENHAPRSGNLEHGDLVGERYRVEGMLGRGAMGAVYRVERVSDHAQLALKLLIGDVTRTDAARFAREGELAAKLRHPNLVPVVDVGLDTSGALFLVMELVQGSTLEKLRPKFGEAAFGLAVLRDVTRGLCAVHEAGIVHRDLKPSNVLMDGATARLADFGVARPDEPREAPAGLRPRELELGDPTTADDATLRPEAEPASRLTQTGAMVGTPMYMAPEIVLARGATRASDVFSLGLLSFELLTGRYPLREPPFVGLLAGRPMERVVPRGALPEHLRELVPRMLHPDPERRPTAAELLGALG